MILFVYFALRCLANFLPNRNISGFFRKFLHFLSIEIIFRKAYNETRDFSDGAGRESGRAGKTTKKHLFSAYAGLPREIYILFAARIVTCLGSFINPLLTLILTQKLGFSASDAGEFSALLILTQAPSLVVGGKLADRIGRKKLAVVCQMLGSAFFLLCGLNQDGRSMRLLLILASDLYTAATPALEAMTADYSTEENRQASFSLIYLGINIGMSVSPLFAGLLFRDHLALMFLLDAATTFASALILALFVRETGRNGARAAEETEAPETGGSVFRVLWGLPVLTLAILFQFSFHFTYSQWSFLLPLQLGDYYGDGGAMNYSMMSALNSVIVVFFTPVLTALTLHRRPLRVIALSGVLFGAAYAAYGAVRAMPLFLAAAAVFTFGEILSTVHAQAYLANRTPGRYLGRVNAFALFVRGAGNALGPLAVGRAVVSAGYFYTWLALAAFVLLGAGGILALDGKDARPAAPEGQKAGKAAEG